MYKFLNMIPNIMLPHYCKWIGLVFTLLGYMWAFRYGGNPDNVNDARGLFIQVLVLVGLLMIAGAKEKTEDEMIRQVRLVSLQWSVFILIFLRLSFKCVAFYTKDTNWLPHWQVNSMLVFYLALFYYQLYIKDSVLRIGKRDDK